MDRALVIEFFQLHAQAASAERRLKTLRAILKPQLVAGEGSPADLPYLLVLGKQTRTEKDYRAPLFRLLKRLYGKASAAKRIAVIEKRFVKTEIPEMNVEQNKAYAAQLGNGLPPELEKVS